MDQTAVVLVTGSSSGFGRLIVETLGRRGCRVAASMRDSHGKNAAARAEIEALARQERWAVAVVNLDVTDDRSVASGVAEVLSRFGRLDVVVNNAGIGSMGVTEAYPTAQVQALFETNFFGAVRVNRAALPHLRRQGSGLLVHVTSTAGRVLIPFLGPYSASKFALEALAEAYHHDLAPLGIDSVIVEPGIYPTNIGKNARGPDDRACQEEYAALKPRIGQVGQAFEKYAAPDPQEVADAIAHLIALPAGQRPLRTLLGPDARRLERLNQVAAEVQTDMLRWVGMIDTPPG